MKSSSWLPGLAGASEMIDGLPPRRFSVDTAATSRTRSKDAAKGDDTAEVFAALVWCQRWKAVSVLSKRSKMACAAKTAAGILAGASNKQRRSRAKKAAALANETAESSRLVAAAAATAGAPTPRDGALTQGIALIAWATRGP